MNISNSPVSILNNVNASPKNGETAPTLSHVESPSLMEQFFAVFCYSKRSSWW